MANDQQATELDKSPLTQICHDAQKESYATSRGCSGCVRYFAFRLGVFLPGVCNYDDGRANALIDYMDSNWTKITKEQALLNATQGKFVVAGKKAEGPGHVVVVLPALAEPKNKWGKGKQSLVCCSLTFPGGYAGAFSDADKTVWDSWGNEDGIGYWLAPTGPSACAEQALAR